MNREDPKPVVFLSGDRIYLRPLDPDDLQRALRWINDPQTREMLAGPYLPVTEKMERDFIESAGANRDQSHLAIMLRHDDRHIGVCGFNVIRWRERAAIFGLFIGEKDLRGKGYGTDVTKLMLKYAFETLNLNRVELGVMADNQAGIRAYERAGFVREGVQREHCYRGGRYVDQILYAVLARDYFAAKAASGDA